VWLTFHCQFCPSVGVISSSVSCYICGQFTVRSGNRTQPTAKIYEIHLGLKIGDQDQCQFRVHRRTWLHGKSHALPLAIPMVWSEPGDWLLICLTRVSQHESKQTLWNTQTCHPFLDRRHNVGSYMYLAYPSLSLQDEADIVGWQKNRSWHRVSATKLKKKSARTHTQNSPSRRKRSCVTQICRKLSRCSWADENCGSS
jgi:hypothetical protein